MRILQGGKIEMEGNQALFDAIFDGKVRQAQRLTPEQRLLASLQHSDEAIHIMRAGVRFQFPEADDDEIERRLVERVRLVKSLHERR
jgi:hypothetical protein